MRKLCSLTPVAELPPPILNSGLKPSLQASKSCPKVSTSLSLVCLPARSTRLEDVWLSFRCLTVKNSAETASTSTESEASAMNDSAESIAEGESALIAVVEAEERDGKGVIGDEVVGMSKSPSVRSSWSVLSCIKREEASANKKGREGGDGIVFDAPNGSLAVFLDRGSSCRKSK